MNSSVLFPALLVMAAGVMIAVQAPTNAILAKAGGSPILAALISFIVGTLALTAAWLASGNRPAASAFAGLPWYAWIGGLYGAFFVGAAAFAAPRIGLASMVTIAIAGQLAAALLLDHYGALGLTREPVNVGRIAGALLVVAGVILVRRS